MSTTTDTKHAGEFFGENKVLRRKPLFFAAAEVHAEEIDRLLESLRKLTGRHILMLGKEVHAAHEKLLNKRKKAKNPEGGYQHWVRTRIGVDPKTADRWMTVYLRFGIEDAYKFTCDKLSYVDPSALYLLAHNSTPYEIAKEARKLAEQGTRVTHAWVRRKLKLANGPNDPVEPKPDDDDDSDEEDARILFEEAKLAYWHLSDEGSEKFREWLERIHGPCIEIKTKKGKTRRYQKTMLRIWQRRDFRARRKALDALVSMPSEGD